MNCSFKIIAHIDMDCFYVQVERERDKSLYGLPVAVVQYNPYGDLSTKLPESDRRVNNNGSLIAVSYEARNAGVSRFMRGLEAKKVCPQLQLIQVPVAHGKADIGIYRNAGEKVLEVISQRFKCIVEKASVDEVYLDITEETINLYQHTTPLSFINEILASVIRSEVFISSELPKDPKISVDSNTRQINSNQITFNDDNDNDVNNDIDNNNIDSDEVDEDDIHDICSNNNLLARNQPTRTLLSSNFTISSINSTTTTSTNNSYNNNSFKSNTNISTISMTPSQWLFRNPQQWFQKQQQQSQSQVNDNRNNEMKLQELFNENDCLLICASYLVSQIRKDILEKLGFTCSAGVANTKLLAKVASAMHKPNKQTIIPSIFVPSLMSTFPLSKLRGFGGKLGKQLKNDFGVTTAGEVVQLGETLLSTKYEISQCKFMISTAKGELDEPLTPRTLPENITCGKTFRGATGLPIRELSTQLQTLSPSSITSIPNSTNTTTTTTTNNDNTTTTTTHNNNNTSTSHNINEDKPLIILKWIKELCGELMDRLEEMSTNHSRSPKQASISFSIDQPSNPSFSTISTSKSFNLPSKYNIETLSTIVYNHMKICLSRVTSISLTVLSSCRISSIFITAFSFETRASERQSINHYFSNPSNPSSNSPIKLKSPVKEPSPFSTSSSISSTSTSISTSLFSEMKSPEKNNNGIKITDFFNDNNSTNKEKTTSSLSSSITKTNGDTSQINCFPDNIDMEVFNSLPESVQNELKEFYRLEKEQYNSTNSNSNSNNHFQLDEQSTSKKRVNQQNDSSSSTIGYDIYSDKIFTIQLEKNLKELFNLLNINLIIRNVGIGTNLCFPYGICVNTFGGYDSDIVFWEHTFDCGYPECSLIIEQFIRQALTSPSNPIIALGSSYFPNWNENDCNEIFSKELSPLSIDYENVLNLFDSGNISSISSYNIDILDKFKYIDSIIKHYELDADLQLWEHSSYYEFRCHDPYVINWGYGVAPWCPSEYAHNLRADQLFYFWSSILLESLLELQNNLNIEIDEQINLSSLSLPSPLYISNITDSIQCYTNFVPRAPPLDSYSINSLILTNVNYVESDLITKSSEWIGWHSILADDAEFVIKKITLGHYDLKYSIYGSSLSGPISFSIHVNSFGYIFICESPSVKKKFIPNIIHLWESKVMIFLTKRESNTLSNSNQTFHFDQSKSIQLDYFYSTCEDGCTRQGVCMQIIQNISPGYYILTLIPTLQERIIISTILIP